MESCVTLIGLKLTDTTEPQIVPNGVYCLDCLIGLSRLDAGSVDLVFADPPFNIGYGYDVYKDNLSSRNYLVWTRQWMAAVVRVLSPTGTVWVAMGDEYVAEVKMIAQDLGLTMRNWVIWYYTFGAYCTRRLAWSHTHLLHFVKNPKKHTFDSNAIRVPSARAIAYADARRKTNERVPDDTWILRPQEVPESFTPCENTWYSPRLAGSFRERVGWHPCQMPERILERIIQVSSKPGDLVVDPFAGSGTTLAVAKKLGRKWIGFEVSEQYVEGIRQRLNAS